MIAHTKFPQSGKKYQVGEREKAYPSSNMGNQYERFSIVLHGSQLYFSAR
jgi:hypothetical protein